MESTECNTNTKLKTVDMVKFSAKYCLTLTEGVSSVDAFLGWKLH